MTKKEEVGKSNSIFTYGLLILASVIIGMVSPHGLLKSTYTLFFMFIVTFGIQTAVISVKPLLSSAVNYSKKQLRKSKLLDKNIINTDAIEGGLLSSFLILCGFLQIFIVNYFIQRYTGVQLLDSYIIIFWALLQFGIRVINYFIKFKTGENLRDISLLTNVFDESENSGKPKINITLSTIVVLVLIFIFKNNPMIVEVPEMYLENGEDFILGTLFPGTKIQKYKAIV